ncbi:hypothetical protein L1049_010944 [Liquidambar formosana]|uniref:Uncharacterized protein n=1 Tax=Liquidambar formosana TaxID=63359 RepID=A0AAP0RW10_LIQFO
MNPTVTSIPNEQVNSSHIDSVGWSDQIQFRTPPAGGSDELKFLAFGDMGKAPRDASVEHYIQYVNSNTRKVEDSFRITKGQGS